MEELFAGHCAVFYCQDGYIRLCQRTADPDKDCPHDAEDRTLGGVVCKADVAHMVGDVQEGVANIEKQCKGDEKHLAYNALWQTVGNTEHHKAVDEQKHSACYKAQPRFADLIAELIHQKTHTRIRHAVPQAHDGRKAGSQEDAQAHIAIQVKGHDHCQPHVQVHG